MTTTDAARIARQKAKVVDADVKAQQWLARWNQLEESGKRGTKAARDAERKAHYWLDRLNRLEGRS